MKYITFLTDGSENVQKDLEYLSQLYNAEIHRNFFVTQDITGFVLNIHSHRLMGHEGDELVIMPSVTSSVDTELITKKIELIKNR